MKISGCVVLYNPDISVLNNIVSYLHFLEELIVFDNSDTYNYELINELTSYSKIVYINGSGNKGIAYALNLSIKSISDTGADWILTMDQDSHFNKKDIAQHINYVQNLKDNSTAIVAPVYDLVHLKGKDSSNNHYLESTMTSGNLIRMSSFNKTSGFREDFFIDYVDHEFCLRIRRLGFTIQQSNAKLTHSLGTYSKRKIFFITILYTNHNPIRRYYMTRNRLYVIAHYFPSYPVYCLKEIKNLFVETLKIIVCEPYKKAKMLSILRGTKDFILNKYGKYSY